MLHPVNTRYQVTGTLEKNDIQTIVLATPVDAPDDIVVINEIRWNGPITPELGLQLRKALGTLDAYEEDRSVMRMITRYYQGYPLHKYVDSFNPSPKERVNICYEFLKHLHSYNKLPHWIQGLLIDDRNILYWDNKIWFNEVLYLDQPIGVLMVQFTEIAHRIRNILLRILGTDPDALKILSLFLEELGAPETQFHSLSSIYESFKKIYLYAFYLDSEKPESPVVPVILPDAPDPEPSEELEQVLKGRAIEADEDDHTAIWEAFLTEEQPESLSYHEEQPKEPPVDSEVALDRKEIENSSMDGPQEEGPMVVTAQIETVEEAPLFTTQQEPITAASRNEEEPPSWEQNLDSIIQDQEPTSSKDVSISTNSESTEDFSYLDKETGVKALSLVETVEPVVEMPEPSVGTPVVSNNNSPYEITVEGTKVSIPDHLTEGESSSIILSIAAAIAAAQDRQEEEARIAKEEMERIENQRLEQAKQDAERLQIEQQALALQEQERLEKIRLENEKQESVELEKEQFEQESISTLLPEQLPQEEEHEGFSGVSQPTQVNLMASNEAAPAEFPPKLWAESSFWNDEPSALPSEQSVEGLEASLLRSSEATPDSLISEIESPSGHSVGNLSGKKEIVLDLSEENTQKSTDASHNKKSIIIKIVAFCVLLIVIGISGWFLFSKMQATSDLHPSFRKSQHQGTWYLQNTSTTSNHKVIGKYQWTIRLNKEVIGVYNTEDLLPVFDKDGTYDIEFKIQDQNGQWSKPYTDSIQVSSLTPPPAEEATQKESDPEQLNMYNYQFDAQRISADDAVFRNGTISLRVKPGSKGALLTVNGFQFAKESYISLWITGEKGQTVQFSFRGFNAADERFSKAINYTIQNENQWEVVQFPVKTAGIVDNMIISIRSSKMIWIDDLSIGTTP